MKYNSSKSKANKCSSTDNKSMPWFRIYHEILDDPKVQRLDPPTFKNWINLLCLAAKNGGSFEHNLERIAWSLRISNETAEDAINALVLVGLLDILPNGSLQPHNWSGRQFVSDKSTDRVRKYRDKRRAAGLPQMGDYSKFKDELEGRDGSQCVYCEATENLVVDHMVPISQGGTDDIDNLALSCRECNSGKAGRTPDQAGYKVRIKTAETALTRYQKLNVTVTETPPDTESDTDTESEAEKETETDSKKIIAAAAADEILVWLEDQFSGDGTAAEFLADQIYDHGGEKVRHGWQDYKRKLIAGDVKTHSFATLRGFISQAMPSPDPASDEPEHMRMYREAMERMKRGEKVDA